MSGERHSFYKQIHKGIRALAPPPAFQAMAELARRVLPPAEWRRLERSLAVAA